MTEEKLIKSNQRVKNHGEVFTPKRIVNLMLDQEEIQTELQTLTATFLEPAAGEGAFLTEVLRRKLVVARTLSSSIEDYEQSALLVLTSLYGIELLVDNCRPAVYSGSRPAHYFGKMFTYFAEIMCFFIGLILIPAL